MAKAPKRISKQELTDIRELQSEASVVDAELRHLQSALQFSILKAVRDTGAKLPSNLCIECGLILATGSECRCKE